MRTKANLLTKINPKLELELKKGVDYASYASELNEITRSILNKITQSIAPNSRPTTAGERKEIMKQYDRLLSQRLYEIRQKVKKGVEYKLAEFIEVYVESVLAPAEAAYEKIRKKHMHTDEGNVAAYERDRQILTQGGKEYEEFVKKKSLDFFELIKNAEHPYEFSQLVIAVAKTRDSRYYDGLASICTIIFSSPEKDLALLKTLGEALMETPEYVRGLNKDHLLKLLEYATKTPGGESVTQNILEKANPKVLKEVMENPALRAYMGKKEEKPKTTVSNNSATKLMTFHYLDSSSVI